MFATFVPPRVARPRLLATAVVLSVFSVVAGHPTLAKSVGADVWNVPALNEELRESAGVRGQLDAEGETIRRRIAVKESLVDELLDGRATLADVTAKFAELNVTCPAYQTTIRASYPGATDHEREARNVISFALLRAPAGTRSALTLRLDAELQQMIALSGTH